MIKLRKGNAASIGVLSFASDCVCLLMAFFVFSILGERKAHQPMTAQRTLIFE
jgi:cytochrome c biogenesis protein CcdA